MFSRLKRSIYQHRQVLIGGTIIVGGAILATKYLQKKLLDWQDRQLRDSVEKTAKEQHFRSTERTCRQTVLSLSDSLKTTVLKLLDTEQLLNDIKHGSGNKVKLWDELKIMVFTQISTLLYSALMMVILLKIQLNILSGSMFKEKSIPPDFQEHYLSLVEHFLSTGVKELISVIEKHVTNVVKDLPLKQKMTLQDIEHIFWSIETSLSNCEDPLRNSSKYLLPQQPQESFQNIIQETYDLLSSEEIISVGYSCIRRSFSNTVDSIANNFGSDSVNIATNAVPLAKIVPIVHRLFKNQPTNGSVDPWIEQFLLMDKINILAATIYEAFSNKP